MFFWKRNNSGSGRGKKDERNEEELRKKSEAAADNAQSGFSSQYDREQSGFSSRYEGVSSSEKGFANSERSGFSSRYEGVSSNEKSFANSEQSGFSSRCEGVSSSERSFANSEQSGFSPRYGGTDDKVTNYTDSGQAGIPPRHEEVGDKVTGFSYGYGRDDAHAEFPGREERIPDGLYGRPGYMPNMGGRGNEKETRFRENSQNLISFPKERWMLLIVRTMTGENIFVSETPFYIGRSPYRVHFRVNNPQISNVHAVITKKNDAYYIRDVGSLNGTYINGERLSSDTERVLYNGMAFELAGETFTVVFRKAEA